MTKSRSHTQHLLSGLYLLLLPQSDSVRCPLPNSRTRQESKGGHPDPFDFAQDKGTRRISPSHDTFNLGTVSFLWPLPLPSCLPRKSPLDKGGFRGIFGIDLP
jgi:hypothetical protein